MRLAEAARRYGARVTVDLSTAHGIAELGRDEMRRRVARLEPDVVFANEAEAAAFGDPLAVEWVVKRGALGCTVERNGETLVFSAVALDGVQADGAQVDAVVDTTGAGDAFAAGYLLGGEPESAARRGLEAAARCVTRVGALP